MIDDATALGAAAARLLVDSGRFPIKPGLTDTELAAVEGEFGFSFADDHRAFLAAGLPWGRGWPDWRDGDHGELRERLALPVEGVLFDVVKNGFWYDGWGRRPADDDICSGATIVDYLAAEFGLGEPTEEPRRPTVAFWSRLV
jgi:hypothetical protein